MTQLPSKPNITGKSYQEAIVEIAVILEMLITYLEEQQKDPVHDFFNAPEEVKRPVYERALEKAQEEQRFSLLKNATYTSEKGWHITLKKPEWWNGRYIGCMPEAYQQALNDVSNALGITINLE